MKWRLDLMTLTEMLLLAGLCSAIVTFLSIVIGIDLSLVARVGLSMGCLAILFVVITSLKRWYHRWGEESGHG